jgi:aspartyl-tRNA(Asn)/glutamyl-tRNA(Gln) amidotransferase subunit A
MTPTDLAFTPIRELGDRMRRGALSPVALAEHCLGRIGALNPALNAFITVTADLAREQARAADEALRSGRARRALHGIPVAVKDFYDTAGIRTTAAAPQFANRIPARDAELVTSLREAGAVLVGKTNMHTLGMGTTSLESHFGPVVNPWSVTHVAGGSSGGSAAAVAAGLCFATVDTDAVGSGRLPAAICGVACFKPTYGALSTKGILEEEPADPTILALSHPCITARSVDDVALVYEALIAARSTESESALQSARPVSAVRRVGVVANCAGTREVKAPIEGVAGELSRMGIALRDARVPFESARFDVRTIERDRAAIEATLFADVDALVLPTLTAPTPTVDEARARGAMAVSPDNTFFCNYYGLPAIGVPAGADEHGLPLGVQFVGPKGGDARVLALAQAYQRATGWRYEPPPERFDCEG